MNSYSSIRHWALGVGCSAFALCLIGCATAPQSGLLAQVQSLDDSLAAKYNVPPSVVSKVRQTLGIPVAKDLPAADRILPVPWVVYYDVLDRNEAVVDTTGYHYGTTPRIRRSDASTLPASVFNPITTTPTAGAAELESVLAVLGTITQPVLK